MSNYLWANRYNIAISVVCMMITWHVYVRKLSFARVLILGGGFLAILQGLRAMRFIFFSDIVGRNVDPNFSFWQEISLSLHLSEFDAMMLALRDVGERFNFRYGADFYNGLLSWIPRSLLPSKESFHIGEWLRQAYDPSQVNGWPPSIPAAWYVNFGILGIPLGAMISGYLFATFDAHYGRRESAWNAVLGVMLVLMMTGGGLSMGFPQQIVLSLIPLWIIALLMRSLGRKRIVLFSSPTRRRSTMVARH